MRRPAFTRRGLRFAGLLTLVMVALLVLAFTVTAAADTLSNISPASPIPAGGWMGRYPVSNYQIDQYFPAISVSLFGGINVSGLMPMVAYAAAQVIWLITAFISDTVITVFQFAFNLNLLTGEGGSGGALAPISEAIHNIYTHTFGAPWLVAAVAAVGVWAMWKALVQRRYTQTSAALATSLIYCVVALGIVAQPAQTITPLSNLSNEISQAFLSLTSKGTVGEGGTAAQASSGQLFQTLVVNPWTVLEFGGIEHCVNTQGHSVAVQPLSRNAEENTKLSSELEEDSEVSTEGKRCINNREKYAPHFLDYPYQSASRNAEYEALKAGEDSKLPSSDPAKNNGSYPLGKADEPAAEAAGKGGQYERLLLSILILAGEAGVWVLLGALAAGVILAQILLLGWLMLAPVVLPIAAFPGRGHTFFVGWIRRLLSYLARKAIYSLILAILLAVAQALQDATSSLGWLMSFLLFAAFMWTVLLQRHQLTAGLMGAITGSSVGEEPNLGRLQSLLAASTLTQVAGLGQRRQPPSGDPPAKPKAKETPDLPPSSAGASTPTTTVVRVATAAKTSEASKQAASATAGSTRRAGTATPSSPLVPTRSASSGSQHAPSPRASLDRTSRGRSEVQRSSGSPSKAAARTSKAAATTSKASVRPATITPTAHRTPPKAAARTATRQMSPPASATATPLPSPQAPARQSLPARPAQAQGGAPRPASTPTSAASRAASTTTTSPAPEQADRPKEAR